MLFTDKISCEYSLSTQNIHNHVNYSTIYIVGKKLPNQEKSLISPMCSPLLGNLNFEGLNLIVQWVEVTTR